MTSGAAVGRELSRLVGAEHVHLGAGLDSYLQDATEVRGLHGFADAAVSPASTEEVAAVVGWCERHDVAIVPRGGGTGYAGGAVPDTGVVLSLERLTRVRTFEPLLWRGEVEAGITTHHVRRLARESGLSFPPDPGAAEQSHIGGNVATNAGGPHAFKYGVTGAWVDGLEAVLASGEIVTIGGSVRKDVAGYDLRSLLIGSEGTLGVLTAVSLRFMPAVPAALPVVGAYPDTASGCAAVDACRASGIFPAAIEYLDAQAVEIVRDAFPAKLPAETRFVTIAEADGEPGEAHEGQQALREAMEPGALSVSLPTARDEVRALWRWRDGVGLAADAAFGGKVSEDIAVPVDRLAEGIEATREIAARYGLASCSWGHAGDANLHSTFLFRRDDDDAAGLARRAADDLFEVAVELGGTVSGEHGVGQVKNGQLRRQWAPGAVALHEGIKRLFDPKGLLNPGKKLA